MKTGKRVEKKNKETNMANNSSARQLAVRPSELKSLLPETVDQDTRAMRPTFLLCIQEIEAVLARKKPFTDITKFCAIISGQYVKKASTEVHDKALELTMLRMRGGSDEKD
jgi:hypothetical protein